MIFCPPRQHPMKQSDRFLCMFRNEGRSRHITKTICSRLKSESGNCLQVQCNLASERFKETSICFVAVETVTVWVSDINKLPFGRNRYEQSWPLLLFPGLNILKSRLILQAPHETTRQHPIYSSPEETVSFSCGKTDIFQQSHAGGRICIHFTCGCCKISCSLNKVGS